MSESTAGSSQRGGAYAALAERMNELNRKALSIVQGRQNTGGGSSYMAGALNRKANAVARDLDRTLAARHELDAQARSLGFTLEHLAMTIGTVIHGADLSVDQTPEELAFFYDVLRERKVMFFRNQDISTEQHLAFSRNFGHLEVHPFIKAKAGYPEVVVLGGCIYGWMNIYMLT